MGSGTGANQPKSLHLTSTANNKQPRRYSKHSRCPNLSDVTSSPPTVPVASASMLKAGYQNTDLAEKF